MTKFLSIVCLCLIVTKTHCWCSGEHFVTCEHLSDIAQDGNKDWTHLTVGNLYGIPNETLKSDLFDRCPNVKELTVVSTVKDIERFYSFTELKRLEVIRLYNNSITLLPDFSTLSELVKIDAQYNKIVEIDKFPTFSEVVTLNLSNNKIRAIGVLALSISTLESITLTHNEFTELTGRGTFPPTLLYLNLDSNKLNHIEVDVFLENDKLEELILSNNKFTSWWITYELNNLKTLDLSHNSLSIIEVSTFRKMPNLETLYINHNLLKQLPTQVFHSGANQELKLAKLYLHNNRLEQLEFLIKNVWPNLKEISIFENPWPCDCLDLILVGIGIQGIKLTSCDSEYINSGDFPVCIDINSTWNGECSPTEFPLDLYDQFFKIPKNYQCKLSD